MVEIHQPSLDKAGGDPRRISDALFLTPADEFPAVAALAHHGHGDRAAFFHGLPPFLQPMFQKGGRHRRFGRFQAALVLPPLLHPQRTFRAGGTRFHGNGLDALAEECIHGRAARAPLGLEGLALGKGRHDFWFTVRGLGLEPGSSLLKFGRIDDLSLPDGGVGGGIVAEGAALAAGGHGDIDLRQPLGEVRTDAGECGIGREVLPFVGIGEFVVEFLAAVGIADVAPPIGADGVVALVVAGDGGPFAFGGGILELWKK